MRKMIFLNGKALGNKWIEGKNFEGFKCKFLNGNLSINKQHLSNKVRSGK